MEPFLILIIGLIGPSLIIFISYFWFIRICYKKVPKGQALIRTGWGKAEVDANTGEVGSSAKVSLEGIYVLPILHVAEYMDITIKKLTLNYDKHNSIVCKDGIAVAMNVDFFIRINPYEKDILQVAQIVGCERAGKIETIKELFEGKIKEAIKYVCKQGNFQDYDDDIMLFKHQVLTTIGRDLDGYILNDMVINDFKKQN